MVTLIKYGALGGGEKYNTNQMWIDGLSTDTKPTTTIDGMGIPNGSVYTEVDTGKTYMFDKDTSTWYEVSLGGGGGGGGGFTPTQAQLAAMNSGITSEDVEQIDTNTNNLQKAIKLIPVIEIKTDNNILNNNNISLGTGWTGDYTNGYVHASGNSDPITATINATAGDEFIIEWDYTGTIDKLGFTVSVGSSYAIDVYNGTYHVIVGAKAAENGQLIITPFSTYSGTLTNLSCKKVNAEGTNTILFTSNNIAMANNSAALTPLWNVSLGIDTLAANINGSRNIAIGVESLKRFESGTRNIAIGTYTIPQLINGEHNVAIGADAGLYATESNNTIAIGKAALGAGKKSTSDIAIGFNALYGTANGTSTENIAIGKNAGYKCSSSGNTFIGTQAGYNGTSYNNTCIGSNADVSQGNNRSIAIGANAKATKSQQCVIGSTAITEVVFCGNKKINFNNDGTVTWESL